jgi:cytochrome c biogenesis protein CcmG, thiol:disulfide interchange protein DsbE
MACRLFERDFSMTHGPRFAVLLGCFAALSAFHAASAKDPLVGAPAPNFQVTTFDGKKLTLADFKGDVLVINFWATWCGPCKKELPMLDRYYQVRQDAGLRVLAVTTEDSLPASRLQKLASVLSIPMVRRFKGDYGPLKAVPTNYIIDRSGVLRYAKAAALTLDDMNEILVPLLREPGPDAN